MEWTHNKSNNISEGKYPQMRSAQNQPGANGLFYINRLKQESMCLW